jgi:phosphate transport system ATP-binding protein
VAPQELVKAVAVNEPKTGEPAIVTQNLSVSFLGRRVLDDVTVDIRSCKLSVIVGRSGAGKSTFLRALNRLNESVSQCVTSGTVRVRLGGALVEVYKDAIPLEELRRRVGMVFQTPHVLPFSVERNMTLPLTLAHGFPKRELADRSERALREVQLWDEVKDRLKDSAFTLSGGQQQRLCLARALALEPDILLLDEPTASLDFKSSEKIEGLLERLRRRYTVVAVSHSLAQAKRLADAILVMRAGTVSRTLTPPDFAGDGLLESLMEEAF